MGCILYSVDNFLTVGRRFYFGECFYLLKATWSRHVVSACMQLGCFFALGLEDNNANV